MSRINVMQPWLGEEEIAAVTEVIASGWVAQGPRVAAFETAFAARMQTGHAVATSSCTTALHLALVVAGVQPDDDVVVPSFSFIATANSVVYVGARPVFADVDHATGNLTAETVQAALTDRTRAVIAVDQGGVPVDLDPIRAVCDPLGIVVVEDAACGAGSTYRERPVGVGADVTAWSFHPRKLVTTGEGGMLTTGNADWAQRARRLREHAMSVSAADRHGSVLAPPGGVRRGRLQLPDDRRAGGDRPRAARAARPDGRAPTGDRGGVHQAHSRHPRSSPRPGPGVGHEQLPVVLGRGRARLPALTRGAPRPPGCGRHLRPSRHHGLAPAARLPDRDTGDQLLPNTEQLTDSTLILPVFHQITDDQQARVVDALVAGR